MIEVIYEQFCTHEIIFINAYDTCNFFYFIYAYIIVCHILDYLNILNNRFS